MEAARGATEHRDAADKLRGSPTAPLADGYFFSLGGWLAPRELS